MFILADTFSLHNENKPIILEADGTQKWWKHGQLHRDNDQPAIIHPDGTYEWWQNGKLHRDHGLPAVIYSDGVIKWYINGVQQEVGELDGMDFKNLG